MKIEKYEEFEKRLKEKFPVMFAEPYGGICVDEGWWTIVEALCGQIDVYTKWRNNTRNDRLKNNPNNLPIPEEVDPVIVTQIKEKFGGLRFYYDGGDDKIDGMVRMAEEWADHTCEQCGNPGKQRHGGWIKTLCDDHELERQAKMIRGS